LILKKSLKPAILQNITTISNNRYQFLNILNLYLFLWWQSWTFLLFV